MFIRYTQDFDPSATRFRSAIFAVLPLITLFVLLGGLKLEGPLGRAGLAGVALLVAIVVYGVPVGQALDSGARGRRLRPVPDHVDRLQRDLDLQHDGRDRPLRRPAALVRARSPTTSASRRCIIAFCFGALLEALAGFGTPVAITAVMLIALGFKPIKAAALALVADTAPVAFGAIAIPIITLGQTTGLPKDDLGAMVGRQTPFLALDRAAILVAMVDGRRGLRQAWPAALVGGLAFALGQFATLELHLGRAHRHRRRARCRSARSSRCLRVWQPAEPLRARAPRDRAGPAMRRRRGGATPALRGRGHAAARRGEGHRRLAPGHARRLRAVPDHHRDLRDRADRAVKTWLADTVAGVRLARASTSSTPRARRRRAVDVQRSTTCRPRARCCSSPACSRCSSCASAPGARCGSTARR